VEVESSGTNTLKKWRVKLALWTHQTNKTTNAQCNGLVLWC